MLVILVAGIFNVSGVIEMGLMWANLKAVSIGAFAGLFVTGAALAAPCGNTSVGFEPWVADYKKQAASQGVSARAIAAGLDGVTYDPNIIRLDRGQKSFKLSFEQFYARRVSSSLLSRAKQKMSEHAALFSKIEQRYGVPPQIIVAIWALETNFGSDGHGGKSIPRSLATLAFDCRRTDFFQNELIHALRIIDRGDMSASQLVGGWAGEIGPMQFLPSSYFKYAVDFDGNGSRDLMRSVPDMLASTANFLKSKGGWKTGQSWAEGSGNYAALREWNKAEVYVKTISVMADKLSAR